MPIAKHLISLRKRRQKNNFPVKSDDWIINVKWNFRFNFRFAEQFMDWRAKNFIIELRFTIKYWHFHAIGRINEWKNENSKNDAKTRLTISFFLFIYIWFDCCVIVFVMRRGQKVNQNWIKIMPLKMRNGRPNNEWINECKSR